MDVATLRTKYRAFSGSLTERSRRLWAASEAMALGHGGIALVERATGVSRSTIARACGRSRRARAAICRRNGRGGRGVAGSDGEGPDAARGPRRLGRADDAGGSALAAALDVEGNVERRSRNKGLDARVRGC